MNCWQNDGKAAGKKEQRRKMHIMYKCHM